MKKSFAPLTFAAGAFLGVVATLCLAAVQNPKAAPTNPPPAQSAVPLRAPAGESPDWARLKFIAYPGGGTGIFDPLTATIYVYDADLNRCYLIRKLHTLGEPMQRW